MSKILTAVNIARAWMVHTIAFFVPRSAHTWIFIGWHRTSDGEVLADNAKYMFLHASHECPDVTAVWIAKDVQLAERLRAAGYSAHSIHSWHGIWYSLRAKYTFVDAFMTPTNWQYSGGSKIIQLWHGKGMKKTGHDSPYSLARYNRLLQPNLFVHFTYLVASSQYTAKLMASTFRESEEKILVSGLPRDDVFFRDLPGADIDAHQELASLAQKARRGGTKKVVMYAPTFRPDGTNPLTTLDLDTLHEFLKKRNFYLILSLHPKLASRAYALPDVYTHIGYISAGYDVYPPLKEIDMLVTDYSSLYVDFLLLDRPIIFHTYDLARYKTEMGLHDDFERLTPGPHTTTQRELLDALDADDTYHEARAKVRTELFVHTDGNASQRIASAISGCDQ